MTLADPRRLSSKAQTRIMLQRLPVLMHYIHLLANESRSLELFWEPGI
jgi:hypothetical protein